MLQTYQAASPVSPHVVDLFHLSRKILAALDNLPAIVTFCGANLGPEDQKILIVLDLWVILRQISWVVTL